jgi:hypothetical protein
MIEERQSFVHFFRKNAVPRQRYCEEEIDNLRNFTRNRLPLPNQKASWLTTSLMIWGQMLVRAYALNSIFIAG